MPRRAARWIGGESSPTTRRQRAIAARQRHVHVASEIDGDLKAKRLGLGADERMGDLLAGAIGLARHADAVEGLLAQRIEEARGQGDVGTDVAAHADRA